MLQSQESSSSVFYHSQDEGPGSDNANCAKSLGEPLNLRQATDARPSSGDSPIIPGKSATLCASLTSPEAMIATFY